MPSRQEKTAVPPPTPMPMESTATVATYGARLRDRTECLRSERKAVMERLGTRVPDSPGSAPNLTGSQYRSSERRIPAGDYATTIHTGPYSSLNEMAGSTRVARRAGTQAATIAARARTATARASRRGSPGDVSKTIALNVRRTPQKATRPTPAPAVTAIRQRRTTATVTFAAVAPR